VAELTSVELANRLIEAGEKVETPLGNTRKHPPPIHILPAAPDKPAFFEPVQQPRNVRLTADHAGGDLSTQKTFRRPSQDAEHIVLVRRKLMFAEKLGRRAREQVGSALQFYKQNLFRAVDTRASGMAGWTHTLQDGRWNR
jgi:hypothetical protein